MPDKRAALIENELREWLTRHLAQILRVDHKTIMLDRTLEDYGLDSIDTVLMSGEIEEQFGLEIDPTTFSQYATFEDLIAGLVPTLEATTAQDVDAASTSDG